MRPQSINTLDYSTLNITYPHVRYQRRERIGKQFCQPNMYFMEYGHLFKHLLYLSRWGNKTYFWILDTNQVIPAFWVLDDSWYFGISTLAVVMILIDIRWGIRLTNSAHFPKLVTQKSWVLRVRNGNSKIGIVLLHGNMGKK